MSDILAELREATSETNDIFNRAAHEIVRLRYATQNLRANNEQLKRWLQQYGKVYHDINRLRAENAQLVAKLTQSHN
jgi:hypothetical protein